MRRPGGLLGPVSGYFSDRYGARLFSMGGMLVTAAGFVGLALLPVIFAAPNTTAIMNAGPPEHRGVASGMRATFMNAANTLSITIIFTLVVIGQAQSSPITLFNGLTVDCLCHLDRPVTAVGPGLLAARPTCDLRSGVGNGQRGRCRPKGSR